MTKRKVLILGASYGMLPGAKLALSGHEVTFVGRTEEVGALRKNGITVRLPLRRGEKQFELKTRSPQYCLPSEVATDGFEIALLAMQEPQLGDAAIGGLMSKIASAGIPIVSIMNLPPQPFCERLGLTQAEMEGVYSAPAAWAGFAAGKVTNASPDPQAIRMNPDRPEELTVTLASNFKVAPFAHAEDQAVLQAIARDLSRLKVESSGIMVAPPVKMLAQTSLYVPLAKWPMLIAGNCRCLTADGMRSIGEAVHDDLQLSQRIYEDVTELARRIGAPPEVMVPFDQYAKRAVELVRPSSLARALTSGVPRVERIDRLALNLAQTRKCTVHGLQEIHDQIEDHLRLNGS